MIDCTANSKTRNRAFSAKKVWKNTPMGGVVPILSETRVPETNSATSNRPRWLAPFLQDRKMYKWTSFHDIYNHNSYIAKGRTLQTATGGNLG